MKPKYNFKPLPKLTFWLSLLIWALLGVMTAGVALGVLSAVLPYEATETVNMFFYLAQLGYVILAVAAGIVTFVWISALLRMRMS